MPATRRSGAIDSNKEPNTTTLSSTTTTRRSPPSEQLPGFFLVIYPIILGLGSLYSVISPTANPSISSQHSQPLAPGIASDLNHPPLSYFARKDNFLNQYFVKVGWLWTTASFLALILTQPYYNGVNARAKRIQQALSRFAIITFFWILTTQWFFGPALIDRSFRATGGRCEYDPTFAAKANPEFIQSGLACKMTGGDWKGGHDISGHVFLLVTSSASLLIEKYALGLFVEDTTTKEGETAGEIIPGSRKWGSRFTWVTISLDFWMLFMTAIWFHTWTEKLSGLGIATTALGLVYYLPRVVPEWRQYVGMPGA